MVFAVQLKQGDAGFCAAAMPQRNSNPGRL